MMSDVFDLITTFDGKKRNFIDLEILKEFSKNCGVEYDENNEEEVLEYLITTAATTKKSKGKISKAEFLKIRNLID